MHKYYKMESRRWVEMVVKGKPKFKKTVNIAICKAKSQKERNQHLDARVGLSSWGWGGDWGGA